MAIAINMALIIIATIVFSIAFILIDVKHRSGQNNSFTGLDGPTLRKLFPLQGLEMYNKCMQQNECDKYNEKVTTVLLFCCFDATDFITHFTKRILEDTV